MYVYIHAYIDICVNTYIPMCLYACMYGWMYMDTDSRIQGLGFSSNKTYPPGGLKLGKVRGFSSGL